MVGHQTLNLAIGVRVPASQPNLFLTSKFVVVVFQKNRPGFFGDSHTSPQIGKKAF